MGVPGMDGIPTGCRVTVVEDKGYRDKVKHHRPTLLLAAALFAAAHFAGPAGAADFLEDVRRDAEALSAFPSRILGSPGHEEARDILVKRIEDIPGVRLVRQPFPVMVPTTKRAELVVEGGAFKGTHAIHPVWPDNVRLKSTPAEGLTGTVSYIGLGQYKTMSGVSLRGNIAAMEMSAYAEGTWLRAFNYGARAVLLLGSRDDSAYAPGLEPIFKPRYYVPDGPLAEALRKGAVGKVTVRCDATWETKTAENLLALLPGTDPTLEPIILAASYDAMSVVPALAPGADNAVDAAFLLRTLTHLARHAPKRGVMVAFVDAFGFNLIGMRELMAMLTLTRHDSTREAYEKNIQERLDEYREIAEQVRELGADASVALPKLQDKIKYKLLQRYVKDVISPERIAVNEEVLQLRLDEAKLQAEAVKAAKAAAHMEDKNAARQAARQAKLKGEAADAATALKVKRILRQAELDSILSGIISKGKIPEGREEECASVWQRIRSRCAIQLEELTEQSTLFEHYDAVRQTVLAGMNIEDTGPIAFPFVFGIDLSDSSVTVGRAVWCEVLWKDYTRSADKFTRWFKTITNKDENGDYPNLKVPAADRLSALGLQADELVALIGRILNRESIAGGSVPSSLAVQKMGLITSLAMSFQTNGMTWATLEGIRPRLDTPQDTFDRLDWGRLDPQIRITAALLEMLLNDEKFAPQPYLSRRGTFPKWHMPDGVVVSESVAETIARTPRPDMLVTTFNDRAPPVAGIRGLEFVRSGSDGRFRFKPVPANCSWQARNRFLKAYSLADDGRIVRAIAVITSMLTEHSIGRYTMSKAPPLAPLRGDTFDCIEVNGPTFRDPRYQKPLFGGKVLDVGRGGVPKKHYWNKQAGPMFGLLQPDTHYQLILGSGGRNRMTLLNIPEDLNEKRMSLQKALRDGFDAEEPLPALPELISARDFFRIDEWRLRRLESAGVVCKAIRGIHKKTRALLDEADAAYAADRGGEHMRASASALANEVRVYQAVQDQANDVTRGSIFLLLLLVPFAIAMERLLFASAEIAKQIGKSMAIFVVMFVILASFHPGFKITTMPAVILIAFMVLLLSVSVINMVLSKFRADMEELRRGTLAEASGAQTGRGGVIMSAIWLGIANMRKRMVRTLLTGLTIVLVTFSLLCFTSSSTYQDKRTITLDDVKSAHNGVLLQHPSSQKLDIETEESVANMLGADELVVGRYWAVYSKADANQPLWRLHVRNPRTNKLAALKAGLGLRPEEDQFTKVGSVLKDWDRFAEGAGCYVSETTAEVLGVKAGDTVVVAGATLEVLDAFDGRAFEKNVRKLDGQTLLPIDYSVQKDDGTLASQESMESVMASGEGAQPDPTMVFVSADEVIILPVALAKKVMPDLRSVAIRSSKEDVVALANKLVGNIVYPVYYGVGDSVKAIVSTPLLPKAPRNLAIPILIAALIIFNTMLNSIAERKKEIYIYSSLGLAPKHIGVLFLAEAMTYGVMGSVFGYIIGQGVAKILTGLNLMGGITLNYSGSNVIMTMGLVLLVVMASAIVPAIMAAKVASPSGDLDWKVPAPKDGVILGQLPFTVSEKAAPGLAAFLYEYIDAHTDGAIGNFTSANLSLESGEGDTVVRLKATIWPAPYDLGVRQDITINFDKSEADICDLHIRLDHRAGQERSWWRLNRVFLGDIRSQLLGWRNIAPERMLKYIRQSDGRRQPAPQAQLDPAKA